MFLDISVIIPCYNSEMYILKNIIKINNKIKKHFKKIEYILINDGSTDGTLKSLKEIQKSFRYVKIIDFKVNIGKSNGIKSAIKISKGEKILLYDADIPYFNYLGKLLTNLKKNPLVIINRRQKKSKIIIKKRKIYNYIRLFIGNLLSLVDFYFFNINVRDTQAGLKGFSNSLELRKRKFISKKFFLDIELLIFFKKKNIMPLNIAVIYVLKDNVSSIKLNSFKNNFLLIKEYSDVIKSI
jgi:glycosyltransferase involved in cell wall biosynthesis